jgi:hypothetical protein
MYPRYCTQGTVRYSRHFTVPKLQYGTQGTVSPPPVYRCSAAPRTPSRAFTCTRTRHRPIHPWARTVHAPCHAHAHTHCAHALSHARVSLSVSGSHGEACRSSSENTSAMSGTPVGGYLRASAYGSTRRWGTQAHARGSGVPVQREVDRVDRAVVRVVLRRGLERDVRLVHSHWQPHAQPTGCARADATAQRNDRRVATQHGMSQRSTILRNLM